MAKGNMLQGMARGSVGDIVFSHSKGQQVARVRNRKPANPKSGLQMKQRSAFLCPLLFYKRGKQAQFKFAFENKGPQESDFNALTRLQVFQLHLLNVTLMVIHAWVSTQCHAVL